MDDNRRFVMSTIQKQSVSEDCVELRLNHKTIGLAPLKGAHIPRIGDFVFLPGNEEPVSATIQRPSTYYEVEKVVLVYGQPDQSELRNTGQPLSAILRKAIVELRQSLD